MSSLPCGRTSGRPPPIPNCRQISTNLLVKQVPESKPKLLIESMTPTGSRIFLMTLTRFGSAMRGSIMLDVLFGLSAWLITGLAPETLACAGENQVSRQR